MIDYGLRRAEELDPKFMGDLLVSYEAKVATKYGFDDKEKEQSQKELQAGQDRLAEIYGKWAPQIDEYQKGFERIEYMAKDPKRSGVESLRKQRDEIETKWRGLVKPVLSDIDKVGALLQDQLHSIAGPTKVYSLGEIPFELPSKGLSVRTVDRIIPIFDMVVGILLIIGLLTPVAALAAGIFLASVVLTQFPGYPERCPLTIKQSKWSLVLFSLLAMQVDMRDLILFHGLFGIEDALLPPRHSPLLAKTIVG